MVPSGADLRGHGDIVAARSCEGPVPGDVERSGIELAVDACLDIRARQRACGTRNAVAQAPFPEGKRLAG